MGSCYRFTCDHCGFSFNASGPWEFYRDRAGTLKHYGHPIPASEEARAAGVYGMYGRFFCLNCEHEVEIILREARSPVRDSLLLWMGAYEPKERVGGDYRCPCCSGKNILLFPEDPPHECPHCVAGRLIGVLEWIS